MLPHNLPAILFLFDEEVLASVVELVDVDIHLKNSIILAAPILVWPVASDIYNKNGLLNLTDIAVNISTDFDGWILYINRVDNLILPR